MAKVQITCEVSKETIEFGDGLAHFIATVWPKLKDGFQVQDSGIVIAAALALVPALKGVESLPAEAAEDIGAFGLAGAVTLSKIVKALKA